MYNYRGIIYSEAGSILQGKNFIGTGLPESYGPFVERKIDITDLVVTEHEVRFDCFVWDYTTLQTYADAKKFVVSKRYTNDDQIAIMLNKDEDEESALAFQKMQEWREWASILAKKIMEVIESNETDRQHTPQDR